jgi:hypothetical protein
MIEAKAEETDISTCAEGSTSTQTTQATEPRTVPFQIYYVFKFLNAKAYT